MKMDEKSHKKILDINLKKYYRFVKLWLIFAVIAFLGVLIFFILNKPLLAIGSLAWGMIFYILYIAMNQLFLVYSAMQWYIRDNSQAKVE